MQRKVIQQSATSIGISLPAKWAAKWGLKKGGAVEVLEDGNKLTINAGSHGQMPRTAKMVAQKPEGMTRRIFDALYKKGYDEVEISYSSAADLAPILKAIDDEAKTFEIVKQGKGICVVRSISELDKEEFDNLLHRTVQLLAEMMGGIASALAEDDRDALSQLVQLERTNNRFTHVMRRALNRSEYYDSRNALLLYVIIEQLEKAADEMKRICTYAAEHPKVRKETVALAQQAVLLLEQFAEAFYAYTKERVVAFAESHKRLAAAGTALLERGNDAVLVAQIMGAARIVYELAGPLTAMQH